ncbi:AAA family ATPase [Methylicorpusculum sp.]|uniref:bifunctional aminoglycoside phosphotransferase/ATP-binding protein n=1 Tax=Methylicorpusculum sp. TaxID=2713644 RepID=UPI00272FD6CE|nr:bifunctional aminoglycoside phosphotransferase/ATP-binding protein [Methylicorpusculum sp.]MDP2178321.1 AAA family ATPase [Methylicorpusculum sp.]MDP3531113.1 AAA family ATPase [Methylicorpusculum sp.]MDZ4151417.1 AAA family ATPase [Methylicorpusculum sp.]
MTLPEFDASLMLMIDGLTQAQAYRHKVESVKLIETHISWVFLTGAFAYKIKKPVNFGFLDFSSLEKRAFYCQEELRLNQRLSPQVYLGVVAITGSFEKPEMEGDGEPIEYAVKMLQFNGGDVLTQRVENGCLSYEEIDEMAGQMGRFHLAAAIAESASPYGELEEIAYRSDENFQQVRLLLGSGPDLTDLDELSVWSENELAVKRSWVEARKAQGFVRECHGDLHLGNMTLHKGQLIVFDCLEFNPLLRWIDVISELAFIVMDLAHSGLMKQGIRLVNHYLQLTGDYQGIRLLRYYLVYRAMVLAKVALFKRQQAQSVLEKEKALAVFHSYLKLAGQFIHKKRPVLIITCGFSGSGKSTLCKALAEQLGSLWVRSDSERKRMLAFSDPTLQYQPGKGLYSDQSRDQVYQHLLQIGETVLAEGFSLMVDATFLKRRQRMLFYQLAHAMDADFLILQCEASESVMSQRIDHRSRQHSDPSEATAEVMRLQMKTFEPLTQEELAHTLRVNTENDVSSDSILEALRRYSAADSALL